jgi:nucleoside-diphosphate-sugar epimerase
MTLKPCPIVHVPPNLATVVGYGVELVTWLRGKPLALEVAKLTPATLAICRLSYVFSVERAKLMLGWSPLYTVPEALQCMIARYLVNLERDAATAASAGLG